MSRIVLGRFVSYLITLLIGYFVTRRMLAVDVAEKLMKGDTVQLWGGSWNISLKQIVDFITISIIPALVPIGIAIWGRVKERYKLIVARLTTGTMSDSALQREVEASAATEIIKTVVGKP